jgi:hypothetical protein
MADTTSGSKPPEFWLLEFREIVEGAIEKRMCNISQSTDVMELSKTQHIEMLNKVDQLVTALNTGLKALYIAIFIVMGIVLIGVGGLFFAIAAVIK